jgi:hypothetical protein
MQKERKVRIPGRTMSDWSTKGIQGYVSLMLEFLRLSPSYALAKQLRESKATEAQQRKRILSLYNAGKKVALSSAETALVLNDFEDVLKTYDLFGDVSKKPFKEWWQERGLNIYGSPHSKPKVWQIARIEKDEQVEPQFHKVLDQYLTKSRANEGKPISLVVGIPLGMPKNYLLRQVSKLIDMAKVELPTKSQRASRPLAAKRLRSAPLFIQLHTLMYRARLPDAQLWKIGTLAKVSPKHAEALALETTKKTLALADPKEHMAILTSRTLLKAKYVAENAARGSYPNSTKVIIPHYDFDAMYERMRTYRPELKARKSK